MDRKIARKADAVIARLIDQASRLHDEVDGLHARAPRISNRTSWWFDDSRGAAVSMFLAVLIGVLVGKFVL
ncbi:MAG: hypothetical protein DI587_03255 [Variovorax paradoxus]|nr:MAG: hypothetical protein DI583_03255 [Variovorax paradoxus]PZQ15717.1 MAG: hypothetical protein DI587_03255 [Variovorax paradoxus]